MELKLVPIGQGVFDKADCDTAKDIPCILIEARAQKITLAEACRLHGQLGETIAAMFESAKASLRARRKQPAPAAPPAPPAASGPAALPSPAAVTGPRVFDLGREVLRFREQEGMTQAEFALRAGLARHHICMIECGHVTRPNKVTMGKIARAMRLPAQTLRKWVEVGAAQRSRQSGESEPRPPKEDAA